MGRGAEVEIPKGFDDWGQRNCGRGVRVVESHAGTSRKMKANTGLLRL